MKRKTNKRKRKTKPKTRKQKRKIHGGCGCNMSLVGGSANLADLPARYYYEMNDQQNNPLYPLHTGGKRRRLKGGMPDFLFGPSNAISSFGTSAGATQLSGLLTGTSSVSSDPMVQPVMNGSSTYYA